MPGYTNQSLRQSFRIEGVVIRVQAPVGPKLQQSAAIVSVTMTTTVFTTISMQTTHMFKTKLHTNSSMQSKMHSRSTQIKFRRT